MTNDIYKECNYNNRANVILQNIFKGILELYLISHYYKSNQKSVLGFTYYRYRTYCERILKRGFLGGHGVDELYLF